MSTNAEFHRMAWAAAACGLDVAGWTLETGSPSNGISYSIRTGMGGSSDIVGLPPFGHIGKTRREAEHFLAGMSAAFESVTYGERRNA